MTITRYERITASRTRRGPCTVCGRPAARSKTFEMTHSPFNRNEDGAVRTRMEVWRAVNDLADTWQPEIIHVACATDPKEA